MTKEMLFQLQDYSQATWSQSEQNTNTKAEPGLREQTLLLLSLVLWRPSPLPRRSMSSRHAYRMPTSTTTRLA